MGFGKRNAEPPTWETSRPVSEEDVAEARARRSAGSQGGSSGALFGVVLAVVGIAAGVGGALLHNSWSAGSVGPAVAAQISGLDAHKRIADACMPPLPPRGRVLRRTGQTDEEFRFRRALTSPAYFTCALMRERERFCGSEEKATLVKELRTYFEFVAARQKLYDQFVGDRTAKAMMKMADAVEGNDVSARRPRPEPDATVVLLMQELVREGYLEGGDFGWSVPADIEPHLTGVEQAKTSC